MNTFKALAMTVASAAMTLPSAYADSFKLSYMQPGVQVSSSSTSVETFNTIKPVNGSLTTDFNKSGITGTYTGGFNLNAADSYGGAGGAGMYLSAGPYNSASPSYTLTLSQNINYFGLWFSALDAGNSMNFYNGNTLLYSFSAADYLAAVGKCPGSAYCGNPNNGQDTGEQFAFINFYDANGSFNKIVFSQLSIPYAGFESDNHTIGNLTAAPGGTAVAVTPEPSSMVLLGTGLLGTVAAVRRRFKASSI